MTPNDIKTIERIYDNVLKGGLGVVLVKLGLNRFNGATILEFEKKLSYKTSGFSASNRKCLRQEDVDVT
jgi:hypothetical protein